MKITAQVLLKNEARFTWYSIMSVLPYVDKIRIWDTGSTDSTLKIIDEISKTGEAKKKDVFQVVKYTNAAFDEKEVRQKMLFEDKKNNSTSDWVLILDADEIWWDDSIKAVRKTIDDIGEEIESLVVPTYNMVGDMFHYQEQEAGRYHLAGRVGHYNLRLFNQKIPGLHTEGGHGMFGWMDAEGRRIENRDPKKIKYLNAPYIHATHLQRSNDLGKDKKVYKRGKKFKYEIGIRVPPDFYYPEVFFRPRPKIVPSVWGTPGPDFKFRAFFETPVRKIYRRTLMKNKEHGY